MRLNQMIYFSRNRLNAFFPDRPAVSLPGVSVELDLSFAKVGLNSGGPPQSTDKELRRLRQVRKEVERNIAHFYVKDLKSGDWVFVDLEMGWSTTHEDTVLPDLDDVLVFYGSRSNNPGSEGMSVDLMLCGSTEHLLKRTASAGRMGSGTEWLHRLILKIADADAKGVPDLPDELLEAALSTHRVNRPEEVVRWVYDVIARHHPPQQRARVQGLAQVNFIAEGKSFLPRLVVATPLYVQYASSKSIRWTTRWRLHRDLCRRYGRRIWEWNPELSPDDRTRVYDPQIASGVNNPNN